MTGGIDRLWHIRRWQLIAAVVSIVVIVITLVRDIVPNSDPSGVDELSRSLAGILAADVGLAPPEAFAEMIERPLFSPARRPPATVAAPAPGTGTPVSKPAWTLIGTVLTPGRRSALFLKPGHREFVRLELGMQEEGWELVDVSTDAAFLERQGRRYEFLLAEQRAGS